VGEIGMAKIRGSQKWQHRDDLWAELMAAEILLDSLHQKTRDRQLGKALGHVRSALAKLGWRQKTLKRWIKPAPNQVVKP